MDGMTCDAGWRLHAVYLCSGFVTGEHHGSAAQIPRPLRLAHRRADAARARQHVRFHHADDAPPDRIDLGEARSGRRLDRILERIPALSGALVLARHQAARPEYIPAVYRLDRAR